MLTPVNQYDLMRDNSITVTWSPLLTDSETGARPIESYSLEWDSSTGTWVALNSEPFTDLQFTVTENVVAG
jgi:hypothetical protein